ncbi:hypothetical protein M408DRAFT_23599 [Serendipita vermifera MAFF 305830]|uniref:CHAT domain-containing protein n=1 Tax=Serendipita vermifera MAFF 305830 TaxID=933852 RepID=A0A0C3AVI6_SERVB|nr:hypothetical protein M408DRAFT_23599 [Serendipita vermifera MAFF 305830]
MEDLECAITIHEEAAKYTSIFDSRYANHSNDLAAVLLHRSCSKLGTVDIDRAMNLCQNAVTITDDSDPNMPRWLSTFGSCYMLRYRQLRGEDMLDQAISTWQRAEKLIPDFDSYRIHSSLGLALKERFKYSNNTEDLSQAISLLRKTVNLISDDSPCKPGGLTNLGLALALRFQHYAGVEDLEEAIALQQAAVDLTPDSHPDKPQMLNNLGNYFESRFNLIRCVEDLERAILMMQAANELTSDGHPDKSGRLSALGSSIYSRYSHFEHIEDLEEAISFEQGSLDLTPDTHLRKPIRLNDLGNSMLMRFKCLGDVEDLEEAISLNQGAADITPESHSDRPRILASLGSAVLVRYTHRNDMEDLKKAIFLFQVAVDCTPDGPGKTAKLQGLADLMQLRFDRLGCIEDLDKVISLKQAASELIPENHPGKPAMLHDLGISIQEHFKLCGDAESLKKAVSLLEIANGLTPDDHPLKPVRLNALGNSIQLRFKLFGDVRCLRTAISLLQAAADLTPDSNPKKPNMLNDLGIVMEFRFKRLGDIKDLEKAILLKQTAVDLTPNGHPSYSNRLNSLGNAIALLSSRLDNVIELDRSISILQLAVDLTLDNERSKPLVLNNLGAAVFSRFNRVGDIEDLEKAISLMQRAVNLTPDSHIDKPRWLSNLGNFTRVRFDELKDIEDLEKAIFFLQAAAHLIPENHLEKPFVLSHLGSALYLRFQHLGYAADLLKAISLKQVAVDTTPEGHADRPILLRNLGNAIQSRFKCHGDMKDRENSISLLQAAVDLMPEAHPNKSIILSELGDVFAFSSRADTEFSDLGKAIPLYATAATSPNGPSITRFDAAFKWAGLLHVLGQSPMIAFERAINLLPQVAWLGMTLWDQHAQLSRAGDVVRYAVAVAIELQQYETAIQWFEYGRSIVWQNLLSLRSPLDELNNAHPELAKELQDISLQLEVSLSYHRSSEDTEPTPLRDVARKASTLAVQRDRIIEKIRNLPTFENFLKAKTANELTPAASEGPVAIINVSHFRSDALILIPHDSETPDVSIMHIPLEGFSQEMSKTLFRDFSRLLSSAGVRARDTRKSERLVCVHDKEGDFKRILYSLWLHVVKPILDGLAYQPRDHSRIWWCATGPLAFLPLHAAGDYDSDVVGDKLSDYVVSSYTPTLTAILEQSQPDKMGDFQILTVAQPSTPHALLLPETEREVRQIKEIASGICVQGLINEEATTARVLQAMKESNWIHLACHGMQNRQESMRSGFLLHDKILELAEIIREPLPKADFAFLSACQTATGDKTVEEESVHLAAGMLFSGCKGVIATMWSIQDKDAPKITEAVYRRMLKDGVPNRREAARALHEAVRELRESGADFLSWVPFIHMGR